MPESTKKVLNGDEKDQDQKKTEAERFRQLRDNEMLQAHILIFQSVWIEAACSIWERCVGYLVIKFITLLIIILIWIYLWPSSSQKGNESIIAPSRGSKIKNTSCKSKWIHGGCHFPSTTVHSLQSCKWPTPLEDRNSLLQVIKWFYPSCTVFCARLS